MKIARFEDIEAWKAARVLRKQLHEATSLSSFAEDRDL